MNNPAERLVLQRELDAKKTALERNILGQFATPPALARDIVRATLEHVPQNEPIRFLEPALGTGSFFEALLGSRDASQIEALGVEIDEGFAAAAACLWEESPLRTARADFTKWSPEDASFRCNLLITNPPYVRHHHIDAAHKRALVEQSSRVAGQEVSGLAGLYVHFLFLAHKWLEPGAISAWLIPSEFMDVNYGAALRAYLCNRVTLLRIHRFCPSEVQFDDALVTSTVLIFANGLPQPDAVVSYSSGPSVLAPVSSDCVLLSALRESRKWSSLPAKSSKLAPSEFLRLGDAFTIRRGLATGDNDFFIRPLKEFEVLGLPREFLRPILPPPRLLKSATVVADSNGYPELEPKLALLDCPLGESLVRERYPRLWSYLQSGIDRGVNLGYLANGRVPWYSQERRSPPPIVCTYMGRQKEGAPPFRLIRNRTNAVASNVYLLLYPKPWLTELDPSGALMDKVCETLGLLSAEAFTSEGRVYGGGLHKMEPKELARLPLGVPGLCLPTTSQQSLFAF